MFGVQTATLPNYNKIVHLTLKYPLKNTSVFIFNAQVEFWGEKKPRVAAVTVIVAVMVVFVFNTADKCFNYKQPI